MELFVSREKDEDFFVEIRMNNRARENSHVMYEPKGSYKFISIVRQMWARYVLRNDVTPIDFFPRWIYYEKTDTRRIAGFIELRDSVLARFTNLTNLTFFPYFSLLSRIFFFLFLFYFCLFLFFFLFSRKVRTTKA